MARRDIPSGLLDNQTPDDWLTLARVASAHGVEGWLARELKTHPSVPAPFQLQVQGAALRVGANHRQRLEDARVALDALRERGLDGMVLKGAALVERYYRDSTLRTYGDVDLFVHPQRFRESIAALERRGFQLLDRNWPLITSDLRGQVHLQQPERGVVELHWHLVNGSRQRKTLRMTYDELWDAVRPMDLAGTPCLGVPPGEEIAHLCLHAAMHGCNRFIWLLDIAMITSTSDVDWDQTARRLSRWRFAQGGYLVLALARAWAGADVPLEQLETMRPGDSTRSLYRRLIKRWDLAEPEQDSRLRELFFATAGDGARARAGLVVDFVVPPAGQHDGGSRTGTLAEVRRVTVGTASRIRGKLSEHGHEHSLLEYQPVGDPIEGREAYLRMIDRTVQPLSTPAGRWAERWRVLADPGAKGMEVPRGAARRRALVAAIRALPHGTQIILKDPLPGSKRRAARIMDDAGVEDNVEYLALPSLRAAAYIVQTDPAAVGYFWRNMLAVPPGTALLAGPVAAGIRLVRAAAPWKTIGALVPGRIVVGRTGPAPSVALAQQRSTTGAPLSSILETAGMRAIVVGASKDPNAKITLLLIPPGADRPELAVKAPTTDAASITVQNELSLLQQLRGVITDDALLETIPHVVDVYDFEGRPAMVVNALSGFPMATAYHRWRRTARPALVLADFRAAGDWLAQFQRGTQGDPSATDLDAGTSAALRQRFPHEPALDAVLRDLDHTNDRFADVKTLRTAAHGDLWFGNLLTADGRITGVVDWERGALNGEPVRDLVHFAITYALYLDRHTRPGRPVAGHPGLIAGPWGAGLAYAIQGEGWFPALFRDFIQDGLRRLGAPPEFWREAALAGIASIAATSGDLEWARRHLELAVRLQRNS